MPKRYDFEVTAMNTEVAAMDAEVTTMDTEVTAMDTEGPWNTVTYPKRPHAVPAGATKPKPPAGGGRRKPQNFKSSSGTSRKGRSHPPGRNASHSGTNRPTHGAAAGPAPATRDFCASWSHPDLLGVARVTLAAFSAHASFCAPHNAGLPTRLSYSAVTNNRVIINERPDGENRITVSVRYLRYGALFSPEWGPDAQLSHACFIVFSFEFTSANAQRFTSATVTLDFTSNSQSPKSCSLEQCPIAEALAPEEEIQDLESEKRVRQFMSGKVNLGAGFAGLSADIAQVSAGKSENFTQRSTRTARGAGRATSQVEFFYQENKARKSGIAHKYKAAVILSRLDGPPTITTSVTAHKGRLSRSLQCAKSVDVGSMETSGELPEELRDDLCILRLARRMRW
ncbi:hypothetical protein EXIGLDRAFT_797483 [Exidia glandulosa HHB12029]|uniref:Uncharacterized protein n=1 Tax=Exidia glandulosa HHB12029 TaxID=1314781 RepID=A0A165FF26_EXIGL|nr:hypothetical protein EXIGLDRAFT_797483 [Exidia glandulosa HHB12029]